MPASVIRTRTHYRSGAWKLLVGIVVVFVGMMVAQQWYWRKQVPQLKVELAAAEAEGEKRFEELGLPDGSTPHAPGEKRYGAGRNSRIQGIESSITWRREYEVPGDFETIATWYRKKLQGTGWVSIDDTPPSIVQREYQRGKWQLKIGRHGEWPYPLRTRIQLELRWAFHLSPE